jgi:O-antigen/teichoic acid export membrane protein
MWDELKRLFKHSTIYGAGNVLGKMVGFIMIPFYTHYLTPADYGVLEMLDLSLVLIGLFLTMWMNASIIRHYYDYEDPKDRNQVISTILAVSACIGIAVALCGIRWSVPLSRLILNTPDLHSYVALISLSFFVSCLNVVAWSYFRARQRSVFVVSMDLVNLALTLSLNIYLIAFRKIGVVGVLYSSLISSLLIAAVLTVKILREVGLSFNWHKLKAILAFGAPLVFTSVAAFTINFSDRFFLRHFSTISTVGIYALGYKFGFMLSFLVVQPFDMIWSARMYQVAKDKNADEVFAKLFGYYTLVLVATALGLSLIIKEVIAIIATPEFHQAYKIVPVVALAYVFQGMNRYFLTGIYVAKKTLHLGVIGAVSAILSLALNYFMISRWGMLGAAWATAFSFFAMAGLAYLAAQRVYPIPYSLSRLIMPLALATVTYLASTLVAMPSLLVSVAIKLLLFFSFPVGLYLLGFCETHEVQKAREVVRLLLSWYRVRTTATTLPGTPVKIIDSRPS